MVVLTQDYEDGISIIYDDYHAGKTIGEYIGKTYMETKRRPRYLIESVLLDAVEQEDTPGRE